MAKRKHGSRGHRGQPRRPRIERRDTQPSAAPQDPETLGLAHMLRRALYEDHPLAFLALMSGVLLQTEPRPGARHPAVDLDNLVESFEGVDIAATTAALHVVAAVVADERISARARRAFSERRQRVPVWLAEIDRTQVVAVHRMREALEDGENYYLDVRVAGREALTVVVYVDNNLGQVVKDAILVPAPFAEVADILLDELRNEPDVVIEGADPAAARARIESGLAKGSITLGMPESDEWPAARPVVRWLVGLLPEGGAAPLMPDPTDADREAFVSTFLASPWGQRYDDEDHRALLEDLYWFGTGWGTGDPLRWSPVNVEVLLVDWFPRKVVAEAALLDKLPGLLRDLVRHAHAERGINARRTEEVLGAIDRWTPGFHAAVRSDRLQGAHALAARALDFLGGDGWSELARDRSELDAEAVGGVAELETVTADPLPDEPFDDSAVPAEVRGMVEEVLVLCDEHAAQRGSHEYRTSNRRLLRDLVVADPGLFRGRTVPRTNAAAICYMTAHANGELTGPGRITTRELLEPFELSSATDRVRRLRRALGLPPSWEDPWTEPMSLGSADYLIGARRAELVGRRDQT